MSTLTKAQKIEAQLQMAEARIAKQNADRERLKQTLQVLNSQDRDEILKLQEHEKIRE